MQSLLRTSFLSLLRLGLGISKELSILGETNWDALLDLANQQWLSAIVLDGIEQLPKQQQPPQEILLKWIGSVLQDETRYTVQRDVACRMATLFHENSIRTYVLKGEMVAECYPKPNHRFSSDVDCFLLPLEGEFDAWGIGNDIIKAHGYPITTDYYKNSTFYLSGLTVENHRFMTPFRGNQTLFDLERLLQTLMRKDKGENKVDSTWLYRPPVMVSALFLVEHAYSHFLHEGLTWRHVLDWIMYSRKHDNEIDWCQFEKRIDEYGFRRFYDSYYRLGRYLFGEIIDDELTENDKRMLSDVWSRLDLHETVNGVKGKIALAGNTWRARWKYRDFTEISWKKALWIQIKGFLLIRKPKLN